MTILEARGLRKIYDSGRIYGSSPTVIQQFVSEVWFRQNCGMFNSRETADIMTCVYDTTREANAAMEVFLALGLALALTLAAGPLMQDTVAGIFWFFTYRFTVAPILLLAPVFALLDVVVPLVVYRSAARFTIVERLRKQIADTSILLLRQNAVADSAF